MARRRTALVSQLVCVALAHATPPGAAWAGPQAASTVEPTTGAGPLDASTAEPGRGLDPIIPLAVPSDAAPPQAAAPVQRPPDPRGQYIAQRLQQQRSGVQQVEEEEDDNDDAGPSWSGTGLLVGGGTALFFGTLTLVGGAVRQAEYVPSGCDPDDQRLGFCPIEKNGSGLLTIGTVAVIASVGLLTAGGFVLHRYRRAQVAMQRTPRGTWTAGITLRF